MAGQWWWLGEEGLGWPVGPDFGRVVDGGDSDRNATLLLGRLCQLLLGSTGPHCLEGGLLHGGVGYCDKRICHVIK